MATLKKVTLYVAALATLVACGGGGGDSSPSSNTNTNNAAVLTTAEQMAKAAAAIVTANIAIDELYFSSIDETVGFPSGDTTCPSGGKVTKSLDTSTTDVNDGTIVYSDCVGADPLKYTGQVAYKCEDAACDSVAATAVNIAHEETFAGGIKTIGNGTWKAVLASGTQNDTYKGSLSITKSGLSTSFSFPDGLVSHNVTALNSYDITGKLALTGGNALNCVDGELSYKTLENLTQTAGSVRLQGGVIEISSNSTVAGTVTFTPDGSVKVKLTGQPEAVVSKSSIESYCELGQFYTLQSPCNQLNLTIKWENAPANYCSIFGCFGKLSLA